eukprot:scaffold911_cov361-Prasinococcus_capsulatus_cf.AAC.22
MRPVGQDLGSRMTGLGVAGWIIHSPPWHSWRPWGGGLGKGAPRASARMRGGAPCMCRRSTGRRGSVGVPCKPLQARGSRDARGGAGALK